MSNSRPSPYTPFLRRFTDERAQDIIETRRLYKRVTAAHQASVWARDDAVKLFSDVTSDEIAKRIELPRYAQLAEAFDNFQCQMLALESTIFSSPEINFSKALTLREQVDLNRFLRAQEYFLEHHERLSEQLAYGHR